MSDRPMRLKYLTKMKIILCIFLLCITAVSVFGEPQELNGIVGKSIEFPAAVKIDGFLIHSGVPIGDVTSGRFTAPRNEKYSGRVQWDISTGLFSLSGLKMEDSGEYTVHNTQQNIITVFQLNVYKDNVPVSKPHVSITRNEYPCTIECTAERGTGVILSWYREGEEKPYVSSHVASAPHLHLPQTVERSGTYTCEAKNSVSNEKASITVGDHCTVSVFGESQELNDIEGERIEFPAAVEIDGNLMYSSKVIGRILSGALIPLTTPKYQGRVQWDSSTGLFSLSGLRLEDSGEYTVQDTHENIITVFQLNVYIPVSKPNITIPHNEYPCSILCTAKRGTGVNLTLYRAGDTKRYSSSDSLDAPYLDMTVPVESGTYTCEAKNSVSRQTSDPLTVGAHCTDTTIWILLAVVVYFLFAAVAYFLRRRFFPPASSSTGISAIIFAVVALFIAVVFAVLYGPPAKPTIWIVIAFFVFLLFAAVAYSLWRRFYPHANIRSKHRDDAVRTLLQDIRSMHPDIERGNPAVRQLILDVKTLLDTLGQLARVEDAQALIHNAVGPIILDIRSMHPDIGRGNPAVRKLILDVKTLLDTLVQLAPGDEGWTLFPAVKTLLDTLVQLAPEQLQEIPPDDTGSKSKGFDMSDRKNEQGREEGDPLQNDM